MLTACYSSSSIYFHPNLSKNLFFINGWFLSLSVLHYCFFNNTWQQLNLLASSHAVSFKLICTGLEIGYTSVQLKSKLFVGYLSPQNQDCSWVATGGGLGRFFFFLFFSSCCTFFISCLVSLYTPHSVNYVFMWAHHVLCYVTQVLFYRKFISNISFQT